MIVKTYNLMKVILCLKVFFDKDGDTSEMECNLRDGEGKNIKKNNKKI